MNSKTIILSSISTSYVTVLDTEKLQDVTTLNVVLGGLSEDAIPINLKLDWGDGNVIHINNDLYKKYKTESIFGEILYGKYSSILQNTYSFTYYPSGTALYKQTKAQFLLEYSDGSITYITIPIEIRSNDYFESIGDLKLMATTAYDSTTDNKNHTFTTSTDGYIVESHS